MDSDSFDDLIQSAALAELADGPMGMLELAARLRRRGVLAHLRSLEDERLACELDEIFLNTDRIWITSDATVASTAALLDGVNFSHRVTSSERERGVLDAIPDLSVLDFDADGSLTLAGGGELEFMFADDGSAFHEHGSFVGPPGWLDTIGAPGVVVVSRAGDTVSLHAGIEPSRGDAEEAALRQAFDRHHVEGVLVEPTEIVLDVLCRDPSLFRTPVAPISELFERAQLECRGAWVGLKGELAKPPGVVHHERLVNALKEEFGFDRCCTAAFEEVLAEWVDFVLHQTEPDDPRGTARALAHGTVATAFAEYVLGGDDFSSAFLDGFAAPLAHLSGKLSAPGHYLRALNAERDGRTIDAERELRTAISADPGNEAALLELSWYVADRGDAALATSLLRRSSAMEDDPELEYLKSRLGEPIKDVGRNDSCPCGSGRKFKSCCINGHCQTIDQRADWLCHKIITFSLRPQNRWRLEELIQIAEKAAGVEAPSSILPFLADLAAFDSGALAEFIEVRGVLIPEDEFALVRTWLDSRPALWQVVAVEARTSVEVFATRNGKSVVVTDHSASMSLHVGDYLLARVVPSDTSWLFTGGITLVPLAHREMLLELLGDGAETQDLAVWVGRLFAPVRVVNYEGDAMVLCHATVTPDTTSWKDLSDILNRIFGESDDDGWTEFVEINGSNVVRCSLRRQNDSLVIEANSVERFEQTLDILREAVGDLEIVEDVRTDLSSIGELAAARTKQSSRTSTDEDLPAEILEAARKFVREKEDAWLDESIPALAGLTPRQAAADPTRREDLAALLNEFDQHSQAPSPDVTFDVSRLRHQLGLFN
jgi:hypothetical protein